MHLHHVLERHRTRRYSSYTVPDNKKHHYVPRFYLRAFTEDGRSLALYNLKQQRVIENANLKNQCYRDYMYGKDGSHESNLAALEGGLAQLFKHVLASEALPAPWSPDHETLCILTLLQSARTAYAADAMDDFANGIWKKVLEKDPSVSPDMLSRVRIVNTDPANFAVATMLRHYHLIMDLDYRLLQAHQDCDFITSDNPVVLYNQLLEFEAFGSKTGLVCKGLQIFLPLSPRLTLMFYDRDVYSITPKDRVVLRVRELRDMTQLNALQVASALGNVYFSNAKRANIYSLADHARRFRRSAKTRVFSLPEKKTETGYSQIIGSSREDVRTQLDLTFMKIIKPAKRWRVERMKPGPKPMAVPRNPGMVKDHELFHAAVEAGQYMPTDFRKFLHEKYGM